MHAALILQNVKWMVSKWHVFRYRPKGVLGKGVGNSGNASEMRQHCVKNAPNWVLFYWEKRNVTLRSKMRQKCGLKSVKNARTPPPLKRGILWAWVFLAERSNAFPPP